MWEYGTERIKCDSRSLNTCLVHTATTLVLLFLKSLDFCLSYYCKQDVCYRYLQYSVELVLSHEHSKR